LQCRVRGVARERGKGTQREREREMLEVRRCLRRSDRGRCSSLSLSLSLVCQGHRRRTVRWRRLCLSCSAFPVCAFFAPCQLLNLPRLLAGGHFGAQTQEVTRIKQLKSGQCRTGQLPRVPSYTAHVSHTDNKTGLPTVSWGHCQFT